MDSIYRASLKDLSRLYGSWRKFVFPSFKFAENAILSPHILTTLEKHLSRALYFQLWVRPLFLVAYFKVISTVAVCRFQWKIFFLNEHL